MICMIYGLRVSKSHYGCAMCAYADSGGCDDGNDDDDADDADDSGGGDENGGCAHKWRTFASMQ